MAVPDYSQYANRTLSRGEFRDLGFGDQYDRTNTVDSRLSGSGYEAYHTGQGWGIRQPGQAQPAPQAPGLERTQGPQPVTTQQQAYQQQATVGAQPAQGSQQTVPGAFQQALLNRLAPAPVTADHASIQPALAANKLGEQRGFERNRAMLAERAGAQGLDQNAFNSQLTGLAEGRAGREAAFAGQQVADLQGRQDRDAMSALALAGGGLQGMAGLDQQRQLAELSAQLTREGQAQQGALGGRELDLRGELGRGQLNLGLLGALLSNQQFGQQLGANMGMFGANLNQQALLSLLNGL